MKPRPPISQLVQDIVKVVLDQAEQIDAQGSCGELQVHFSEAQIDMYVRRKVARVRRVQGVVDNPAHRSIE